MQNLLANIFELQKILCIFFTAHFFFARNGEKFQKYLKKIFFGNKYYDYLKK
jgi:hypothetical protein